MVANIQSSRPMAAVSAESGEEQPLLNQEAYGL